MNDAEVARFYDKILETTAELGLRIDNNGVDFALYKGDKILYTCDSVRCVLSYLMGYQENN